MILYVSFLLNYLFTASFVLVIKVNTAFDISNDHNFFNEDFFKQEGIAFSFDNHGQIIVLIPEAEYRKLNTGSESTESSIQWECLFLINRGSKQSFFIILPNRIPVQERIIFTRTHKV